MFLLTAESVAKKPESSASASRCLGKGSRKNLLGETRHHPLARAGRGRSEEKDPSHETEGRRSRSWKKQLGPGISATMRPAKGVGMG